METPLLKSLLSEKKASSLPKKADVRPSGMTTLRFKEGVEYSGQLKQGCMDGKGAYTWRDGLKYEGDFQKNVPEGNGKFSWPDGSTYEGGVSNGLRHGFGIFISGSISYQGQWQYGKKNGEGVLYYNEERTVFYAGNFLDDKKTGWGVMHYASGNTYEGEWLHDQPSGRGTMRWRFDSSGEPSSEVYSGEWFQGLPSGRGEYVWHTVDRSAAATSLSMSQMGGLTAAAAALDVSSAPYQQENRYEGQLFQGQRHGQGTYHYASGARYNGEWIENGKNGHGVFTTSDGQVFEGAFAGDRLVDPEARQVLEKATKEFGIRLYIEDLLRAEQEPEKHVQACTTILLRYLSELKRVYAFYASSSTVQSNANGQNGNNNNNNHNSNNHPAVEDLQQQQQPAILVTAAPSTPALDQQQQQQQQQRPASSSARATTPQAPAIRSPSPSRSRSRADSGSPPRPSSSSAVGQQEQSFVFSPPVVPEQSFVPIVQPQQPMTLSLVQLWSLVKECRIHNKQNTIALVDRCVYKALSAGSRANFTDVHYPDIPLMLREFLEALVRIASTIQGLPPHLPLAERLNYMLSNYVLKNSGGGSLIRSQATGGTPSVVSASSGSMILPPIHSGQQPNVLSLSSEPSISLSRQSTVYSIDKSSAAAPGPPQHAELPPFDLEFMSAEVQSLFRQNHERLALIFVSRVRGVQQPPFDQTIRVRDLLAILKKRGIFDAEFSPSSALAIIMQTYASPSFNDSESSSPSSTFSPTMLVSESVHLAAAPSAHGGLLPPLRSSAGVAPAVTPVEPPSEQEQERARKLEAQKRAMDVELELIYFEFLEALARIANEKMQHASAVSALASSSPSQPQSQEGAEQAAEGEILLQEQQPAAEAESTLLTKLDAFLRLYFFNAQ